MSPFRRLALLFPVLAGLAGCGPSTAPLDGELVFGSAKSAEGDKWVIAINDGSDKMYTADADASGKFHFDKVVAGNYTIKVTHYAASLGAGADAKSYKGSGPKAGPPPMPETKDHPDKWTVPGGPYKLDLSKLPASRKQ